MKNRMPELKRLAEENNCEVEDERGFSIYVWAKDGYGFDDGERSCIAVGYGTQGEYLPEWRQEAIAEAIDILKQEPPEKLEE